MEGVLQTCEDRLVGGEGACGNRWPAEPGSTARGGEGRGRGLEAPAGKAAAAPVYLEHVHGPVFERMANIHFAH